MRGGFTGLCRGQGTAAGRPLPRGCAPRALRAVLPPAQILVPSLDKSTYGFCGQKCRMALCGSSTGAGLPSSPHFPLQHFCCAKTPQDFSTRENQMTQSALICAWGPRKVARPCGVRRTHHSGEGCPLESARLKRRLRPTKKRVCPCQAKVVFLFIYTPYRP